jgi:phage terminase large subunit
VTAKCCWCQSPLVQAEGVWWCGAQSDRCRTRQAEWALDQRDKKTGERVRWLFVPTPKQVTFYETTRTSRRTLYGGQVAGAKSHAIRWGLYRDCLTIPNLNCLLLRRTFKQLEQTHLLAMEREALLLGAEYLSGAKMMRFPKNGSIIQAGHCETTADALNYLSTEYDRIAFDELVTFDRDPALEIMSRARTSKRQVIESGDAQVWAGTNPGGRGARWVKDFFIDRDVDRTVFPAYDPSRYAFVRASLDDNPYMSAEYRRDLEDLPEMRKRQLLYGDWDAFEGQFFGQLHQDTHAVTMDIPPEVEWSSGMDWGHNAPGWFGFFAHLTDGHYHLKKEYKFQGKNADVVAHEWHRIRKELGIQRVRYVQGDPAMWSKTGHGRGESHADTLLRCGMPMRKGDNDRFNGAMRVHEMFRMDAQQRPYLTVDPACHYWWRTIPALVQDANDPEDVDTTQDDHAYDGTRYWAMSRPSPTRTADPPPPAVGTIGWWKSQESQRTQGGILA